MKLKNMTSEQRLKICNYVMDTYAPLKKGDKFRRDYWKACEHCPFSVADDFGSYACAEGVLERTLPKNLLHIVKGGK